MERLVFCTFLYVIAMGAATTAFAQARLHQVTWAHQNPGSVSHFIVLVSPVEDFTAIRTEARRDGAELTAVCIEFGTESEQVVLDALRRENWLHHHGPAEGTQAGAIKAELRDAFAPPETAWRQAVYEQSVPLIDGFLAGLAEAEPADEP